MKQYPLSTIRHSAEHVLMHAMQNLGYKILPAMGPATNDGFYYDFDPLETKLTENDFAKIEEEMEKIKQLSFSITQISLIPPISQTLFKQNPYKLEWLGEAQERNEQLTAYWTGEKDKAGSFVDLCAGPHVANTSQIGFFKLLSIAGAYWRGSEKNKMLTRIYGTAFATQKELDDYLKARETRKENDHRALGKKLDLFCFSDLVGHGFAMYTPKGTIVKKELKNALVAISAKYGVMEVDIPHMAKIDLYKISGHADKFSDELFRVKSHYKEEFVLKPVNCPHHTQIYASQKRSYKDLPIRYIESTQQHRDEKPGAIGGLYRTRSFEVDDGHTFCTPDQIKQEIINTISIIKEFYSGLDMWKNSWASLSFRDPKTPEKYIGAEEDWEKAQDILQEVNKELGLNAKIMLGEAALYGPKIDFMFLDAIGNNRQLGTVQLDFAMPKRFGLTYIDSDGKEKTPVMMHRAILGSYGRFIANLLENTGGAFPVWLSPVQVQIIPISESQNEYALTAQKALIDSGIRAQIDLDNDTMQNKIRKAQEQKIPYMVILGNKEKDLNKISIRTRNNEQYNLVDLGVFTKAVRNRIIARSQVLGLELN